MPTEIEQKILELLSQRDEGKTICPSEAARALDKTMDEVRSDAFAMADRGEIEVTQKGEVVDGRNARGPIRLRLVQGSSSDASDS